MARGFNWEKANKDRKIVERGFEQRSEAGLQHDAEQNRLEWLLSEWPRSPSGSCARRNLASEGGHDHFRYGGREAVCQHPYLMKLRRLIASHR